MRIIIASGYMNPIHIGHIKYLQEAKWLGDKLIVIVNNDDQVRLKGSISFMKENERLDIVKALSCVDEVFLANDKDRTVIKSIESIFKRYKEMIPTSEFIFVKGGDSIPQNVPEMEICNRLGIEVMFSVGGGKIQSSSWLLRNITERK